MILARIAQCELCYVCTHTTE